MTIRNAVTFAISLIVSFIILTFSFITFSGLDLVAKSEGKTANLSMSYNILDLEEGSFVDLSVCINTDGDSFNLGNMTVGFQYDQEKLSIVGDDKYSWVHNTGDFNPNFEYLDTEINAPLYPTMSPLTFEVKRNVNDGQGVTVDSQQSLIGAARFEIINDKSSDLGLGFYNTQPLTAIYSSDPINNYVSFTKNEVLNSTSCGELSTYPQNDDKDVLEFVETIEPEINQFESSDLQQEMASPTLLNESLEVQGVGKETQEKVLIGQCLYGEEKLIGLEDFTISCDYSNEDKSFEIIW